MQQNEVSSRAYRPLIHAAHLIATVFFCGCIDKPQVCRSNGTPYIAPNGFQFHGQPINPACVMKLGTELSDSLPAVAAVDVDGCTQSQQQPDLFTVRNGWVRIELEDNGWFAYRHLGVSPRGTHVLQTQFCGGGTGIFEDLLMVRFQHDRVRQHTEWRERLLMIIVGSFTLGDRDDGEIRIKGDKIVVGRSRYRDRETFIPLDEKQ